MKDRTDKIDRYLSGRLGKEERATFENELSSDKKLAQELAQRKALQASVEAYGDRELKQKLKGFHQDFNGPKEAPPAPRRRIIRLFAAAASILLLLAVGYWLFPRASSTEQLFADNYTPYDIPLIARGETPDRMLSEATDYYSQQGYAIALPLFRELLKKEPNKPTLRFAEAICLLETSKYTDAERSFKQLAQLPNPLYVDHARWYLALTYLKQNKLTECQQLLERLANNSQADHQAEAKQLLEELK